MKKTELKNIIKEEYKRILTEATDYESQINDLIREYNKKIKELNGLRLDAKILYDIFSKNIATPPEMKLLTNSRGLAYFEVVVVNDKTAMAVYEKLKGLLHNSKINIIDQDQYMTMFLTVRDKSK